MLEAIPQVLFLVVFFLIKLINRHLFPITEPYKKRTEYSSFQPLPQA